MHNRSVLNNMHKQHFSDERNWFSQKQHIEQTAYSHVEVLLAVRLQVSPDVYDFWAASPKLRIVMLAVCQVANVSAELG